MKSMSNSGKRCFVPAVNSVSWNLPPEFSATGDNNENNKFKAIYTP